MVGIRGEVVGGRKLCVQEILTEKYTHTHIHTHILQSNGSIYESCKVLGLRMC